MAIDHSSYFVMVDTYEMTANSVKLDLYHRNARNFFFLYNSADRIQIRLSYFNRALE